MSLVLITISMNAGSDALAQAGAMQRYAVGLR
jgi:hypothetical protein